MNLFLLCEPLWGRRWVDVTERRTRTACSKHIKELVDIRYPPWCKENVSLLRAPSASTAEEQQPRDHVANVFGAVWGLRGVPRLERASHAIYLTAPV